MSRLRFLIDAQLPPALARLLSDAGLVAEHVAECGLSSATDREIWEYASTTNAVIVTKDEDFALRRVVATEGPAVIWIRRGNTTRRDLLQWFEPLLPDVLSALSTGESLIEIV